ncbi:MAG: rRNA maturation RNase YbeY [Xanthomonadales bacterium]|nr:rRNA maturation RNase YbeY [Xanthomonadales bacterium]
MNRTARAPKRAQGSGGTDAGLTVHLRSEPGWKGLPAPRTFRAWIELALHGAKRRRAAEIHLLIADTASARALNRDFRGKDYATNVLSFPADLPPGVRSPLLGDLAICADVVAREAAEQGKRLRDHYAHLTIHGTLHLLGYDHIDEHDATAMEALETRLLARIGIADPYTPT